MNLFVGSWNISLEGTQNIVFEYKYSRMKSHHINKNFQGSVPPPADNRTSCHSKVYSTERFLPWLV